MPQVIGAALRFGLLLSTVYAYPGQYSDANLKALAGGLAPRPMVQQRREMRHCHGKTDGGSYTPGETIQVANAGGGQYALRGGRRHEALA